MNAEDVMKYGHLTVMGAIADLPDENWYESGVVGYWSTKDIMAHLVSFEHALVEILQWILDGSPMPTVQRWMEDGQRFNDVETEKRQDMKPQEVLDEYIQAQAEAQAWLKRVPVAQRRQPGILPGYGEQYELEDFLAYTFYGHKREHCAQIAVYRDRLKDRLAGNA